jgi:uncharacterized integral membrane protein
MKNIFLLIVTTVVLTLTIIFILQNTLVTQVKFLFWDTQASLSLILFITFLIGAMAAVIGVLPVFFKLRKAKNMLRRENQSLIKKEKPANGSGEVNASNN